MGGAGAGIGEASCGGTQVIHALSPIEGLNVPAALYNRAPDLGGAPGMTSLGFLGRIFAGTGTVHEASGEVRFSIPLFKISGIAPGFLADFNLYYRSYPGDPDSVAATYNGTDKRPFGPDFRPFWGDKLEVPPQKTKTFQAPSQVTRVDFLGQAFTYEYDTQQGSTYLYKASGRGDRLVCQDGTWYRELPDRTYVEYADVYGTGELYLKRIFWVSTQDPVAVPAVPQGHPLVVEYVYDHVGGGGTGPLGLKEIRATRGVTFTLTWNQQANGSWRVTKIEAKKDTTTRAVEFDYNASGKLTTLSRPARHFFEDINQNGTYDQGEEFDSGGVSPKITFGWGTSHVETIGRKANDTAWTMLKIVYLGSPDWRVSQEKEADDPNRLHTFTYGSGTPPSLVTWEDPEHIRTEFVPQALGGSNSPTKWVVTSVTRKTRSNDPRGGEGAHASLTWTLTWAGCACGRLSSLTLPSGMKWDWIYDTRGLLTQAKVTASDGSGSREWNYEYESWDADSRIASRLKKIIDPFQKVTEMIYTLPSPPAKSQEGDVHGLLRWDGSKDVAVGTEDAWRRPKNLYGPEFTYHKLDGGTGTTRAGIAIEYDADGLPHTVTRVSDAGDVSMEGTTYEYTGLGWILNAYQPTGVTVHYERDANGNPVQITFVPAGNDPPYSPATWVDRNFDGKGVRIWKLLKKKDGNAYDMAGSGGKQLLEERVYTLLGDLWIERTQRGDLDASYDPSKVFTTTRTYDKLHRLVQVEKGPGGQEEKLTWDDQDMLYKKETKLTDTQWRVRKWDYNAGGQVIKSYPGSASGQVGLVREYHYDGFGRRTEEVYTGCMEDGNLTSDGRVRSWSYRYESQDKDLLMEETFKKGSTLLSKTTYVYDAMHRRTQVIRHNVNDTGDQAVTDLTWNGDSTILLSSLLAAPDADGSGTDHRGYYFRVDGLGRRIRKEDSRDATDPTKRNRWETQYDSRGLVTMTRTIFHKEDASGAVTATTERRTVFEYDGLARRKAERRMTGSGESWSLYNQRSWKYDSLGNMVWEKGWAASGEGSLTTAFQYDAQGRLRKRTETPYDGGAARTWEKVYDDANRTVTEKNPYTTETNHNKAVTIRDIGGRLVEKRIPGYAGSSAYRWKYTYATDDRLTQWQDGNDTKVALHYYPGTRKLKERTRTTTDTGASDLTYKETWVYDDLGRVTEEKTFGRDVSGDPYEIVVHSFTFDGLGRQVTESFRYPPTGGGAKILASDFSTNGGKDPAFRRKVVFPGNSGGEHFEFAFTPEPRGYIRTVQIKEPMEEAFRAFAEYGFESSWISARKVHPEPGEENPTIDVTWDRDQSGRLTSIQTNRTFQETLDWNTREELEAVKYPHIYSTQNGGAFAEKWDWYKRDGYSRLVEAKYGVPDSEYSPGNFGTDQYESYFKWTLDLVGNWESKKEYKDGSLVKEIVPEVDHNDSDRYYQVENHPQDGDNPYTYDGNGNLVSDGKYIYEYDYLNRLCAVYAVVPVGDTLSTSSWKEEGLALSKKISKVTAARKSLMKLDRKSYLDLLTRLNARYGHGKFLKTGVPKTLSSVSSSQTTANEDGVLVSRYAYTPSSLRIMRETYESASPQDGNRWWCYDGGRMAVAYGQDGDTPVQTYAEGVSPGEHLALAEWNGNNAQMSKFFLQDAENSLIEIRNRTNLTLYEWRQYDSYGVLTRFDPATGNPYTDQHDSDIEFGWSGKMEILELSPSKTCFPVSDPILNFYLGSRGGNFLESIDSGSDWCDQVPSPSELLRVIQEELVATKRSKNWRERFWGQTHCMWHCLIVTFSLNKLNGVRRSYRVGLVWEVFELLFFQINDFTKWIGEETLPDILFYNQIGRACGCGPNFTYDFNPWKGCWCCCCHALSGKNPCEKPKAKPKKKKGVEK